MSEPMTPQDSRREALAGQLRFLASHYGCDGTADGICVDDLPVSQWCVYCTGTAAADALLSAPEPREREEWVSGQEHYWCGCIRLAWWKRCENHGDLDHDKQPPSQPGAPKRTRRTPTPAQVDPSAAGKVLHDIITGAPDVWETLDEDSQAPWSDDAERLLHALRIAPAQVDAAPTEGLRDAERLDWLEANALKCEDDRTRIDAYEPERGVWRFRRWYQEAPGWEIYDTLREAIDAAMPAAARVREVSDG